MRALLLACALLVAQPARADEARDLYDQAIAHYNIGEYDPAIDLFKRAYLSSRAPALLFNLAQAYRLKGDCASALRFYQNYLNSDPQSPKRVAVEGRIGEMRRCSPPEVAAAPPPAPAPTSGGPRATPAPAAASPPHGPGFGKKVAGIATLVGASVFLVAGIPLAVQASRDAGVLTESFSRGGTWNSEVQLLQQDGQRNAAASQAMFVIGTAAAVVGGVVLGLGVKQDRPAARALFAPLRDGALVGVACDL